MGGSEGRTRPLYSEKSTVNFAKRRTVLYKSHDCRHGSHLLLSKFFLDAFGLIPFRQRMLTSGSIYVPYSVSAHVRQFNTGKSITSRITSWRSVTPDVTGMMCQSVARLCLEMGILYGNVEWKIDPVRIGQESSSHNSSVGYAHL